MRGDPKSFRRGMCVNEAYNRVQKDRRLEEIARRKAKTEEITKMNKKIEELIKAGKSVGEIKQTIEKLYPKASSEVTSVILRLEDGTEIDRLTAQIKDRVEKFRKSLHANGYEERD
jgi:hypothetical protein